MNKERVAELKEKVNNDGVRLAYLEARYVLLKDSRNAPRRSLRRLVGMMRTAKNRLRKDKCKLRKAKYQELANRS